MEPKKIGSEEPPTTRLDELFEKHLQEVFGFRQVEFSPALRSSLRNLWDLAQAEKPEKQVETFGPESNTQINDQFVFLACPLCAGTGMGDYPYECRHCGGEGKVSRRLLPPPNPS